jgi:acetyl-CoA carboxylase carboxyltransferase component
MCGEKVTLEEMGGPGCMRRFGCGDPMWTPTLPTLSTGEAVLFLSATELRSPLPTYDSIEPVRRFTDDLVPAQDSAGYDIRRIVEAIVDAGVLLRKSSRCSLPSW